MENAIFDESRNDANRGDGGVRMANKQNPIFKAWAEPDDRGHGYIALWIAPGMTPDILRPDGKTPAIFETPDEAELAGWRRMAEVLNGPRLRFNKAQGKNERYARMSGPEFAVGLSNAGVGPSFFAYVYGTSSKRVMDWIDGIVGAEVPHPVRVLLALFESDEANIEIAERVTDQNTSERKPKRKDTG